MAAEIKYKNTRPTHILVYFYNEFLIDKLAKENMSNQHLKTAIKNTLIEIVSNTMRLSNIADLKYSTNHINPTKLGTMFQLKTLDISEIERNSMRFSELHTSLIWAYEKFICNHFISKYEHLQIHDLKLETGKVVLVPKDLELHALRKFGRENVFSSCYVSQCYLVDKVELLYDLDVLFEENEQSVTIKFISNISI